MASVTLLWVVILGYVSWQTRRDQDQSAAELARQGAAVVLPLVQTLAGQPHELRRALGRIDELQRSFQAPSGRQDAFVLPRIYAWWEGQPVYRSPDADPVAFSSPPGPLQVVTLRGESWLQYVEDSTDERARFAVLIPAGNALLGINLWSHSLLVLPLIISLPLLVVPAWWSVRVALRPWQQVSREIESREPHDLSPLLFLPRHRELSPLTGAVNRWLERLRSARLRESSFVADAAHELRTPIAAMRVHAEALLSHGVTAHDRELLEGLLTSNTRAGRLVEQLLALTRSESTSALRATAPVDIEALVQESLAQLAPLAQAAGVELELTNEDFDGTIARVHGHADSLRTMIDNIVGNAIKYSPPSGLVRVRLSAGGHPARLTVVDEGPGIPADLLERVFDRFYRVADQSQSGSGLGLAIARAVADGHGGALTLANNLDGRGLYVSLTLPTRRSVGATSGVHRRSSR